MNKNTDIKINLNIRLLEDMDFLVFMERLEETFPEIRFYNPNWSDGFDITQSINCPIHGVQPLYDGCAECFSKPILELNM